MFCLTSFFKIIPGLTKLLKGDRFWTTLTLFIRSIFPALFILRLADTNKPNMDKLYFYVRRMDTCLEKSKESLDKCEKEIRTTLHMTHQEVKTRMVNYFMNSTDSQDTTICKNELLKKRNKKDEVDDSDVSDESSVSSYDRRVSSDDSDEEVENTTQTNHQILFGDELVEMWNKRKKKLSHDVAIVGWMLSPNADIRNDACSHDGEHLRACERLIKKWFGHKVSTFDNCYNGLVL